MDSTEYCIHLHFFYDILCNSKTPVNKQRQKISIFIKNVYIMPHNTKISPNTYLIIYMRKFMTFVMLALFGSIFFYIRNVDYHFFYYFCLHQKLNNI